MAHDHRPISPFHPLMLALALVAGLFIGHDMGGRHPGLLGRREPPAAEKIGRVLDLIDRQYVDTVEKNALVDEVLQDILQRLDPHSYYISAEELRAAQEPLEGGFEGIGVEFAIQRDTVVVVATVAGGPSEALGIRAGDRIVAADGTPMAGIGVTNDMVTKALRGPKGSKVTVGILRRGESFDVGIERGRVRINSVAVALLDGDGTGYIKLLRFAKDTHDDFLKAAIPLRERGMERLILDLRGNGGGYLESAIELADEFLPKGRVIVYTEGRNSPRRNVVASSRGRFEDIPLALLIDEGSASASEVLAGAVQDNDRGRLVGRRTFGKGLVQNQLDLPDNSAVRLTTARYYTPSGRSIQRPYGDGINYRDDYEDRFAHGEMLSADSMRVDSSQVFTTLSGRKVYGGGGVMPDTFVPADTAEGSHYLTQLFFSGTLGRFALDVADRDRERLFRHGSHESFAQRFEVGDALLRELAKLAEAEGIVARPGELERSRRLIAVRLKAGIARNLWGDPGYYGIMLGTDSTFKRAIRELATGT